MIITCPNCQTRYQVAENAIGSAGRKVQCANCQKSWSAVAEPEPDPPAPKPKLVKTPPADTPTEPEDDRLFTDDDEAALDEEFAREQESASPKKKTGAADEADDDTQDAEADSLSPALKSKRQKAMRKRQKNFAKNLPMGRIRGNLRLAGISLLAFVLVGGFYFRDQVVRTFPELAGIYAVVGVKINVVGLDFRDIQTLQTLENGSDVMIVSAHIQNISKHRVEVPAVVITILDEEGTSLYTWSVTPVARAIGPRETIEFETKLNAAPRGAETVQLTFADGRAN